MSRWCVEAVIEVEVIGGVGVTAVCERGNGSKAGDGGPGRRRREWAVIEVEVIEVRFFHL